MTRRTFTGAAVAAGLTRADEGTRIQRIETFRVVYPVTGYFRFFAKPERPAVFVKITCEDGSTGWGQSVPTPSWSYETVESVTATIDGYLAPALKGKNALDFAGAHTEMNRAIAPSFSTGMPIAKAGVDLALHDLAGRRARRNVASLWARQGIDRITLSWTVNARDLGEAEKVLEEGRNRGYRHFNIKVAPDVDYDVSLAKTVRKFAPDCFLWADANGG